MECRVRLELAELLEGVVACVMGVLGHIIDKFFSFDDLCFGSDAVNVDQHEFQCGSSRGMGCTNGASGVGCEIGILTRSYFEGESMTYFGVFEKKLRCWPSEN
jgi:hypothetical protein